VSYTKEVLPLFYTKASAIILTGKEFLYKYKSSEDLKPHIKEESKKFQDHRK
jgi:hypothetical protein